MKVLIASSEVHPYSKTGGLGDMAGALGKALARVGCDVAVVSPLYRSVRQSCDDLQRLDYYLEAPLGGTRWTADVWWRPGVPGETLYFVDQPAFYDRKDLYQEHGEGYPDNAARFLFFSRCVTHLARYLPLKPEIVHVHDWQTGLVPLLIRHQQWYEGWGDAPHTVLTIHNLAYQGIFHPAAYDLTGLPRDYWFPGVEFHGAMNCLKAGIHHADVISTVSPRYAREILTESFGCGLDAVLRHRQDVLTGILNGVDYDEWRTTGNPHLAAPYSIRNMSGKAANKRVLQRELGLPERPETPLFANISRLVDQKGSDLILGALTEMLAGDLQFVQLGSGDPALETGFQALMRRYPAKAAVRIGYDHPLSHLIEGGSDFFLMPSRFEPCGLNQMYSLRYGTVPVVRATGGLDDSVVDATEDPERADGIKFREPSVRALASAIRKALVLYRHPKAHRLVRRNGMTADFSWTRTARDFLKLYRRARGMG